MRLPGSISRAAGRLRTVVGRTCLILMYHRIAKMRTDPFGIAVSPAHFEEQLAVLGQFAACMSVSGMMQRLAAGALPRRAVAISFDDGYADNLLGALPALQARAVPATFYLTPGLLDGRTSFWWDSLARVLLHPGSVDGVLELAGRRFADKPARMTLTEDEHEVHRAWQVWEPAPTPRHALLVELSGLLRSMPAAERNEALSRVAAWTGAALRHPIEDRPLSRVEAATLARAPGVEIGAHTMTHPSLPSLNVPDKLAELRDSRSACEDIGGRRVTSFSYPFGDYDAETIALAEECGFESAVTTRGGLVAPGSAPLRLPRFWVGDWDGDAFARRLQRGFA